MARKNGIIQSWNDDRGFGFILPSDGGKKVFVHIHAFVNNRRRPMAHEPVSYTLSKDKQGRPCADAVAFEVKRARVSRSVLWRLLVSALFLGGVGVSAFMFGKHIAVLGIYVAMSLIAFVAYAWDKSATQRGRWRTPESTLHLWSLLGGWPGALVAQKVFHHKTQKRSFLGVYWITVVVNCAFFGWLHTSGGSEWFGQAIAGLLRVMK